MTILIAWKLRNTGPYVQARHSSIPQLLVIPKAVLLPEARRDHLHQFFAVF
jgi:hypothetical protein